MKSLLRRLMAAVGAAPARPAAAASTPAPSPAATGPTVDLAIDLPAPADVPATAPALPPSELQALSWMLHRAADPAAPIGVPEQRALQRLDALIADPAAQANLLPRGAAVVPQLLARLRSDDCTLPELAGQVSRDITLVAEVIAMANSAFYRRDEAVVELEHAIRTLGVTGLRSAIARAVFKPVFEARSGTLVARAGKRLWEHTDKKAQLCSVLARSQGLDPFDGYLAGLMHNAVWTALLRTLDGGGGDMPLALGAAFAGELATRRNRLFAIAVRQWPLAERLLPLAAELSAAAPASSAAARALMQGDQLATLRCCGDAARAEPLLATLDKSVRACFGALAPQAAAAMA